MAGAVPIQSWTVSDVANFLDGLELHAVVDEFRTHAVNGHDLLELSDAELESELKLSKLQIRKIRRALAGYGAPGAAVASAPPIQPPGIPASAPPPSAPAYSADARGFGQPPPAFQSSDPYAQSVPQAGSFPQAQYAAPVASAPVAGFPAQQFAPPQQQQQYAPPQQQQHHAPIMHAPVAAVQAPVQPAASAFNPSHAALLASQADNLRLQVNQSQQKADAYMRANSQLQGALQDLRAANSSLARGKVATSVGLVAAAISRRTPVSTTTLTGMDLSRANDLTRAAATKINSAQSLLPMEIPYIPKAAVTSAAKGMFTAFLVGGATGKLVMSMQLSSSMRQVEEMEAQVNQAYQWLQPKAQAEHQALSQMQQQLEAKEREAAQYSQQRF